MGSLAPGASQTRFHSGVEFPTRGDKAAPTQGPSGFASVGGAVKLCRATSAMPITLQDEAIATLHRQKLIPIGFEVRSVFEVLAATTGPAEWQLKERRIAVPWLKDYDTIKGEGPTRWARRWNVAQWGLLGAYQGDERVGGAVLAFDTPGVDLLEGRTDLAVLWDLRVAPPYRGQGVGAALWCAAERWARERGCRELKVETQNINVPACRFYARMGCILRAVNPGVYAEFPDEVQLLWYKGLAGDGVRPKP